MGRGEQSEAQTDAEILLAPARQNAISPPDAAETVSPVSPTDDECVTSDCAALAVAEFRWYEDGLQTGDYCEECLAVMQRHYGEGSRTTRYRPTS